MSFKLIDIKDANKLLHYKGLDTNGVNSLNKYLNINA